MKIRLLLPLTQLLSYIEKVILSSIGDVLNGQFKKRKWNKHAPIALIGGGLVVWLFTKLGMFNGENGFWQFLMQFGFGLLCLIIWEWGQGKLGANRTRPEVFESWKDVFVGSVFLSIGILTAMWIW